VYKRQVLIGALSGPIFAEVGTKLMTIPHSEEYAGEKEFGIGNWGFIRNVKPEYAEEINELIKSGELSPEEFESLMYSNPELFKWGIYTPLNKPKFNAANFLAELEERNPEVKQAMINPYSREIIARSLEEQGYTEMADKLREFGKLMEKLQLAKIPLNQKVELELRDLTPEQNKALTEVLQNYFYKGDIYGSASARMQLGDKIRLAGDVDLYVDSEETARKVVEDISKQPGFENLKITQQSNGPIEVQLNNGVKILDIHFPGTEEAGSSALPNMKLGIRQVGAYPSTRNWLSLQSWQDVALGKAESIFVPRILDDGTVTFAPPPGREKDLPDLYAYLVRGQEFGAPITNKELQDCLLYTSPSPRD